MAGRLGSREAEIIGKLMNYIETEAMKLRRNTGNIMTATDVVVLLSNLVRSNAAIPETGGYQHDPDFETQAGGHTAKQAA